MKSSQRVLIFIIICLLIIYIDIKKNSHDTLNCCIVSLVLYLYGTTFMGSPNEIYGFDCGIIVIFYQNILKTRHIIIGLVNCYGNYWLSFAWQMTRLGSQTNNLHNNSITYNYCCSCYWCHYATNPTTAAL